MGIFPTMSPSLNAGLFVSLLVVYFAIRRKRKRNAMPTKGCVPFVRIRTHDLKASTEFYTAIGLRVVEERCHLNSRWDGLRTVVLKCPGMLKQPIVLLEELIYSGKSCEDIDRDDGTRKNAYDVGVESICFGVGDVHREVARLGKQGHSPIACPVTDKPGQVSKNTSEIKVVICAFKDPSGNMVELVSVEHSLVIKCLMVLWQWKHATVPPIFVHVNVNSSCYEKSWEAYRQLGYIKTKEYGRVDNMLYKALCIPDPGIAKLRSMIKLPNDSLFAIDLIEWENPRTVRRTKATETTNNSVQPIQFAVAVADVPCAMDDVMKVGRCKPVSSIKRVAIPFMSEFAVSAIVADPDGLEVELISFPVKNKDDDRLRRDENQGKKVVLISGCDSGFGRSLACRTASLGFKTVAACYTESGAAYLKDIATTVVADFGTKEGTQIVIQAVFAAVESVGDGGQLWSVINNAAVCLPGNVEWLNPDNFEKAMNVNFYAPVKIIYGLLPLLKISKGRIINVSSVCGMVSQPSNAAYCSTKHALESYSDCLRCEMAPFGVNVVIVQPTTMRTPLGMSYFNAWSDSYMSAPGDRQASYSKKWIDTVKKKGNATLEAAAEDPMDVVNAIANALITAHTPTRLPVGRNAFLFFRPVSFLPDSWRDAILFKAVFGSNQISGES